MPTFMVATPSRGLIHSRTVAAVHANVARTTLVAAATPWWIISHDLAIPAAHNTVVRQALEARPDLVWVVEEDSVPPVDALARLYQELLRSGAAVAAVDYPVGEDPPQSTIGHGTSGILWCGLGCTLVQASAFSKLEYPWFRSELSYEVTRFGTARQTVRELQVPVAYGGQDVSFGIRLNAVGLAIASVPPAEMLCGHARLRALGAPKNNQGVHTIDVRDRIERWS